MHLRTKLIFSFLVIALGSFVAAYFDYRTTQAFHRSFHEVSGETTPRIKALMELKHAGLRIVASTSEFGFLDAERAAARRQGSPAPKDTQEHDELALIDAGIARLDRALQRYAELTPPARNGERPLQPRLQELSREVMAASRAIVAAKQAGHSGQEIIDLKETFEQAERRFDARVDQALKRLDLALTRQSQEVDQGIEQDNRQVLVASLITFLAALAIGVYLAHTLTAPLRKLHRAADRLGANQAHVDLDLNRGDELGDLAHAFNRMARETHSYLERLQGEIEQREQAQQALQARHDEQKRLNQQLEQATAQLVQSEKMASIGQLAAGVAHEINNPMGYIASNLHSLKAYAQDLLQLQGAYARALPLEGPQRQAALEELERLRQRLDIDYLEEDLFQLLAECEEGTTRVKRIIDDLKDFSRTDTPHWEVADLHRGLESTLNVAYNELKYKAEVIREYSEIPAVECHPHQINQVVMNLLVNAAHAIVDKGKIVVRTATESDAVLIEVEDDGPGIAPEHLDRIFEPFFTTKPVGKGTGLGLSVSYGIIQQHQGEIEVFSQPGAGTRFRIRLPVRQAADQVAAPDAAS